MTSNAQGARTSAIEVAERRLRLWLFVLLAAAFSIVQEGMVTPYDGQTVYEVTRSLIEHGTVAVSSEFNTLPGRDGLAYSRYGLGMSLLAAIPYAAVRPFTTGSRHVGSISKGLCRSLWGLWSPRWSSHCICSPAGSARARRRHYW
jgi:hypothetical protein